MAKVSSVQRNNKRKSMVKSAYKSRAALKAQIYDKKLSLEERFSLVMKLAAKPRNGAMTRVRNRCELTGRPRGYFRKFALSRNMLRHYAGVGAVPGLVKSSW